MAAKPVDSFSFGVGSLAGGSAKLSFGAALEIPPNRALYVVETVTEQINVRAGQELRAEVASELYHLVGRVACRLAILREWEHSELKCAETKVGISGSGKRVFISGLPSHSTSSSATLPSYQKSYPAAATC